MARPLIRYHLHLNDAQRGSTHCNRWIKNVLTAAKSRMHIIGIVPSEYGGRAEARLISSLRKSGARLTNICDAEKEHLDTLFQRKQEGKYLELKGGKRKNLSLRRTRRLWRERSKRRWATPESRKRHSIQLKGMILQRKGEDVFPKP